MSNDSAESVERDPHWFYCRWADHMFYTDSVEQAYGHVREFRLECSYCGEDLGTVVE